MNAALNALRHHVSGAIERGEKKAIVEQSAPKLDIEFTRIKNDTNGNPRYVCHFLSLNTRHELDTMGGQVSEKYALAVKRANRIGGRKYHCKAYGGGIVFQCYGAADIVPAIERVLAQDQAAQVQS